MARDSGLNIGKFLSQIRLYGIRRKAGEGRGTETNICPELLDRDHSSLRLCVLRKFITPSGHKDPGALINLRGWLGRDVKCL